MHGNLGSRLGRPQTHSRRVSVLVVALGCSFALATPAFAANTQTIGNPTGPVLSSACDPGSVVVGFEASGEAGLLSSVAARCRDALNAVSTAPAIGVPQFPLGQSNCTTGETADGIYGSSDANFVYAIGIACPTANGARLGNSYGSSVGPLRCPAGEGLVGLEGTFYFGALISSVTGVCAATIATPTISTNASANITLGAGTLSDTATVSGRVSPQSSATITFTLYGPDDATCTSAPVFTTTAPSPTASGPVTSSAFTPTQAGTYRWKAAYSGDANNSPVSGSCNDANENTVVSRATPTISTNASADITLGAGTLSDTATVSGRANPDATATITFRLFGPNDATCASVPVFTTTAPYPMAGGPVTSSAFTPTQAGTYRWIAAYSGDANNAAVTGACNDPNESVAVTAPANYRQTVLADTPVGYWRFGESSGVTAFDETANHNDGTYLNGPVLGVPGALTADPNTAVRMDGINDYVRVPDSPSLGVGNTFSSEGWIKRASTAKTVNMMVKDFQVVVMSAANGSQVWVRKPNVSTIARSTTGVPADSAYHHIVVTKNASGSGTVKIYIDGTPVGVTDVSPAQVTTNSATPLLFGSAGDSPADFDEFALYANVLSAARVQAHYVTGHPGA